MASFVRISVLAWADLLAAFAMYVMMTYLTNVWNLSTTHAAGIINIWNGITAVLAIIFAFFVDEFIGDFYMLVLSSISYSIGLGLLSMSTPPVFGPCSDYEKKCIGHSQKVLFYIALPLISVGIAGHLVSFAPFLNLQTEGKNEDKSKATQGNEEKPEAKQGTKEAADEGTKIYWQIAGLMMVVVVPIVGGIALPYIKPWSIRFGIPAICTLVATILFLSGLCICKYELNPNQLNNISRPNPNPEQLNPIPDQLNNISRPNPNPEQLDNEKDARLTSSLSVRDVEDTKIGICVVLMWLTFIVIGIVLSIGNTYFLEQANHMDRKLGKIKVSIPIFLMFYNSTSRISALVFSYLIKCLPENRYAPPLGIFTSMVFSVICCITAAKVESRRLDQIRGNGLLDKPDETIPMSIFALLPQFMLLAAVNGIGTNSIQSFFKYQTPKSMRKYSTYFTHVVLGLGSMASVLSVYIVGKVSERNQKQNWFQFSLNRSRLDRYYWVLVALSVANLVVYIIIACLFKYKESPDEDDEVDCGNMNQGFQENAKCCCF